MGIGYAVPEYQNQNWIQKFRNALRGIGIGMISQNSFRIHLPIALLVTGLAIFLNVPPVEMVILAICITLVVSMELLNTSIEFLAREVTDQTSEKVRNSLDAAAGAVLIASIGSAFVGAWILLPRIFHQLAG